ncbi:MAG: T9SS type A sorting domain-containing protein [Flavobacterium sp.]|uniref:T9SS type A sorting domain-containing protein n=1 Tax=Flavobacterium sp. TaxID=239 RepID=UPI0022C5CCDD|nr:T9SS type A sorting domain-containing protein [Flavobacterium sp.]MCZ8197243.1 T9SS type A sorting domain-containing protein [Flavobacterium sp.]
MKQKYILLALVAFFSFKGVSQSYTVNPIPFQQYSGSLAVLATVDDINSQLITLPFNFEFYEETYNQVVISTNGYIDFRASSAGLGSPWSFNQTIPNVNFPVKNSILGAFHDMNNSNAQGSITYGVSGNAPYRKFVVFYNNNSHFGSCSTSKSSFQMILNETTNIIDVQLIDKQACTAWNNGNCVTGLINLAGNDAIAAPNRNTSSWSAFHEGWRFKPQTVLNSVYNFVKCDAGVDGFEEFNLAVVQNDLNAGLDFYATQADADSMTNPLPLNFTNTTAYIQTIYGRILGTTATINVNLAALSCEFDYDFDGVPTANEDVNQDTNLANDDTDADGLYNFADNDDDGDLVLTSEEYVFPRNTNSLDSDGDSIPNYLDNDDDGDGILTINEDANGNYNPMDDDADGDGIPNFLENSALSNQDFALKNNISIFPNPASNILNIENKTNEQITAISIYSVKGDLIKELKSVSNSISVSELQNGVYFVKIEMNKNVLNYKFVKN